MTIVEATDEAALRGLFASGWEPDPAVVATVAGIIADVRARGDDALVELTRRFDAPEITTETLRIAIPSAEHAHHLVPPQIAAGLQIAKQRVADFHRAQLPPDVTEHSEDGTVNALLYRPLGAVGAYVPGGTAVLPSSVIMNVVPARIAGVDRVVVTTPPRRDGTIDPAILYACSICDVDELYAVGGAQAIAALAYGTPAIARVDKIVGPGNVWVTEAKRQVFGAVGIDSLAGPSEVLVVCDGSANPAFVAGELLAQAEHDPLARVAAVSSDRAILEAVAALLAGDFARETGRGEIVARVLANGTWLVHARTHEEVLHVIDRFAPEHLSLQVADPWSYVPQIRHAGALFVGDATPVAAGDYIAGSNHVLPTSGAARFSSGLRTMDFLRSMSLVQNSPQRMRNDAEVLAALAEFEGLPAHARTARMRA